MISMILFYIPVCLAILSVFETLKQDDPRAIVKKVIANFGILTTILGAGSLIIYLISL